MIIGALKTTCPTDKRSVLHPETISSVVNLEGVKVIFESGIGQGINVSDSEFQKNNLTPVSRHNCLSEADILIVPSALSSEEVQALKKNSIVLGMIDPFGNKEHLKMLETSGQTAVSMEFIPRITRAQKMDVLSSQANLAGYSAVIEASSLLSSALPMMMTAAGTLTPAKVFVIGVGVAGLQAIATAKRLGARVEAFDTRDVVEEQVKSLGAKFVKIDLGETGETDQGYA